MFSACALGRFMAHAQCSLLAPTRRLWRLLTLTENGTSRTRFARTPTMSKRSQRQRAFLSAVASIHWWAWLTSRSRSSTTRERKASSALSLQERWSTHQTTDSSSSSQSSTWNSGNSKKVSIYTTPIFLSSSFLFSSLLYYFLWFYLLFFLFFLILTLVPSFLSSPFFLLFPYIYFLIFILYFLKTFLNCNVHPLSPMWSYPCIPRRRYPVLGNFSIGKVHRLCDRRGIVRLRTRPHKQRRNPSQIPQSRQRHISRVRKCRRSRRARCCCGWDCQSALTDVRAREESVEEGAIRRRCPPRGQHQVRNETWSSCASASLRLRFWRHCRPPQRRLNNAHWRQGRPAPCLWTSHCDYLLEYLFPFPLHSLCANVSFPFYSLLLFTENLLFAICSDFTMFTIELADGKMTRVKGTLYAFFSGLLVVLFFFSFSFYRYWFSTTKSLLVSSYRCPYTDQEQTTSSPSTHFQKRKTAKSSGFRKTFSSSSTSARLMAKVIST